MKKIFAIIIASLMMLTLLTACGDEESTSSDGNSSVESIESVESAEASVSSEDTADASVESNETSESAVSVETSEENVSVEETSEQVSVPESSVADSSEPDSSVADPSEPDSSVADSSEPESSAVVEIPEDIQISDSTYTIVLEEKSGTVTATIYFPKVENTVSGKLVLAYSSDLEYVVGSAKVEAALSMNAVNENYPKFQRKDLCFNFANMTPIAGGTVMFSAQFKLAKGASLSKDLIMSPEWNLITSTGERTTEKDGAVSVIVKK